MSALTSDLKEERERLHEQMQLNQELKQHIETLPVPEEYERLRRKLHLIQAVQFNALDIDAEDGDEEGQLKFVWHCRIGAQLNDFLILGGKRTGGATTEEESES